MAETHRYKAGKAQGFAQETVLKLTEKEAAAKGLTEADKVDVSTTADDSKKANRYEEAMTRQDEMRATEAAAAESTGDTDDKADAGNKKRGTK